MKILLSWNLWNNFQDLEIASEILQKLSNESKTFDFLQISQSGYEDIQGKVNFNVISKHYHLNVDLNHPIVKIHIKNIAVMRIFNSFINAYNFALENNCEYFITTHSDAWIFDLNGLSALLTNPKISNNAVFCRMGINAAIDNSFGEFIPFFDDHFLIFNTKECFKLQIFNENFDYIFDSIFLEYGGIHYLLKVFFDKKVPINKLCIYTNLLNCTNHYNDYSGYNLIPMQFDNKYDFLHANCEQWNPLHTLRLQFLINYNLDNLQSTLEYKKKWMNDFKKVKIKTIGRKSYFKENIFKKIYIHTILLPFNIKRIFELIYYSKHIHNKSKIRNYKFNSLHYLKLINHISPLGITQRK